MDRSSSSRKKVLLVGWDAADWKIIQTLLDRDELPTLARVVEGGVSGNLSSIRPMLSPMLWNSIATGKRPHQHGVHGFTEVDAELGQPVPISSATRRCRALWDLLNEAGLRTHVVGWFATHPAEPLDGVCVSERFGSPTPEQVDAPWPLARGTVFPESLSERLAPLRVRPEEIGGDVLKLFVPGAARVNQTHDKRLHTLAIRLAECFSIHAAATELIEHEPWDFCAVYYRTLDWICHDFMAFHPPKMNAVYPTEFELYHDVVNSAYRLHDRLLGRLWQLAGGEEETTVLLVSDHGFLSDHQRPAATSNLPAAIADWHRPTGVLAMRGAGLRQDELIHGASLLDIAPTVLTLFGLPVGADMDGRVLVEAFAEPRPAIRTVETWETPEAAERRRQRAGAHRRVGDEEGSLVRQFVELGYLDDPGENPDEALRATERENRWNLARSFLDAGRYADALPLLEEVHAEWPERPDYCFELAVCQLNLSLNDEARETAEMFAENPATAAGRLLLANIALRRGDYFASLEHLAGVDPADANSTRLQDQLGLAHLRLGQWDPAEAAFRRSLEIDADNPGAHLGLAHCHLHAKRYEAAAEAALRALGLKFDLPLAHYHLGLALARLGDEPRAIQALETSLRYNPNSAPAHRYLATLLARQPGVEAAAKAREHRAWLNARRERSDAWISLLAKLRRESVERTRVRAEARARRRAQTPVAATAAPTEPLDFLLVSGLPRSGTSLMMQMLQAGGLEIMRDDQRPADADNPRGYFEWQEIKKLPKNPRLIEKTHGRVTKVISALLPFLPRAHRFKILFMLRPLEDVVASQTTMLSRRGTSGIAAAEELRAHRDRMLDLLRSSPNVELLEADYPALLADPLEWSTRIVRFAGLPPERAAAMAAAIAPELCRHGAVTSH